MKLFGVKAENSNKILDQNVRPKINRLKSTELKQCNTNIISIILLI